MSYPKLTSVILPLLLLARTAVAQECPPGTIEERREDSAAEVRVYCRKIPQKPQPVPGSVPIASAVLNPTIALLRTQEAARPLLRFSIEHPGAAVVIEPPEAAAVEDNMEKLAHAGPDMEVLGLSNEFLKSGGEALKWTPTPLAGDLAEGFGGAFRAVAAVEAIDAFKDGRRAESFGKAVPIVVGLLYAPLGVGIGVGGYLAKNTQLGVENYKNQRSGMKPDDALDAAVKKYNDRCREGTISWKFVCGLTGRAQ